MIYGLPVNNSEFPFVPRIKEKAHAIVPLSEDILVAQKDEAAFFAGKVLYQFDHPYLNEISQLDYLECQLTLTIEASSCANLDLLGVPPVNYIDTEEAFSQLLEHLST